MRYWKKLSKQERFERISKALNENVNFSTDASLGYPASKLDGKVFYDDAPFLKDAPVLQTFVANPNHIGCHTLGTSEKAFKGTQEMEREVLNIIATDVFKAKPGEIDGYIAPGGTEANIEAFWIYRNYFIENYNASPEEIAIIATEDTHYSIAKGANLLMIDRIKVPVHDKSRYIDETALEGMIMAARTAGKRYFIVMVNMGTTMFGSVDGVEVYVNLLEKYGLKYKVHIDAAYGGFVYPFSNEESTLNFENPYIDSITIDAHKMLQAPYGTGIFICRKGLIEYVLTREAEYVEGMDLTLCGSRPGYNAVAVWQILMTYGPYGWKEKVKMLLLRTDWLCQQLDKMSIEYFREPHMNIVTLKANHIPAAVANRFSLVPQKHDEHNQWYKVVIMDHVEVNHLSQFIDALKQGNPVTDNSGYSNVLQKMEEGSQLIRF